MLAVHFEGSRKLRRSVLGLVELTLSKHGLAGNFDKLFLTSYIQDYHRLFPNERIFVGQKRFGKFSKEVIFYEKGFAATSNQVTTKSEIEIPDDVVLGSKSIKA